MAGKRNKKGTTPKGNSTDATSSALVVEPSAGSEAFDKQQDSSDARQVSGEGDAPLTPTAVEAEYAPEEQQQEDEAGATEDADQPVAALQEDASTSGQTELAQQLAGAQAEIKALRLQLASKDTQLAEKDAELANLRSALAAKPDGSVLTLKVADNSRAVEETARLHERLAQLRKDQADADSAREAAWRQLKAVVADINRLAAPDMHSVRASTAGLSLATS